ncbi:hypothetical protein V866_007960 [Kwoniella sp. B9012]
MLNEDNLMISYVRSRSSDDITTKKIEILNCPTDRDDVLIDRQREGTSPIGGIIHLLGSEEGEACVCCGNR